jgi:hypothetical protein
MSILKRCAAGLLSMVSLSVLTVAGCAVDPASDTGNNDVSGDNGDEGVINEDAASLLSCPGVGTIYPIASDPNTGAVDVSSFCLGEINKYRKTKNLKPYFLHSTKTADVCCQNAEAKTAAAKGGHADGGCGWKSQGFCGGGRNPSGTAQASVGWCPRLFFQEGPSGGHYQAMMQTAPRGISCSFYAISRDKHSVVVDYY